MYVWWKVSDHIPKTETKERGKLIKNILKKNTSKLIKTEWSITQLTFCLFSYAMRAYKTSSLYWKLWGKGKGKGKGKGIVSTRWTTGAN